MSDRREPLMHKGSPCRHRVFVEAGFSSAAPGWRVLDTLVRGLAYLFHDHGVQDARWPQWRSRRRRRPWWSNCLFKGRTTCPSPVWIGQNPGTEPFSAFDARQDVTAIPRSRTPGAESEHHNATRVSHDPENDHETGIRVAFAPRHPQITHARATSCLMCTCAHRRWF
jgi:hypothetical protein